MINLENFLSNDSAVLISTDVNRRYLCGFNSSYGYLLLTEKGNFLFADSRYFEDAKRKVNHDICVVLLERASKQINEYISRLCIKTLFVETEITVGVFESFKSILNCEVIASRKLTEHIAFCRSQKSEAEIKNIIFAQRIAENAFENALNFIKSGVTEREVALFLDYEMQKNGSEGVSFETIAVSGKNSSMPHGVPTEKKIENGDLLTLDFGAVYCGYHSDMTRTVAVGEVSEKQKKIYGIVLKAQNEAIGKIKAGIPASMVDFSARSIISGEGYAGNFGHGTGHGVGLEIHEYPNVSSKNSDKLLENQIITVEPGIYIPNEFGVRTEDMVLVKKDGCENLTKTPKSLIIIR